MSLLFGFRGRGRGRVYLAARLVLLVAFLIVVFAFHPHGTTLYILQAVRLALLVALLGSGWLARRRRISSPVGDSD